MTGLMIGQLAKATQVNVETVRYYERRGLLAQPARSGGGYRQYGPDATARIRFIKRAQQLGFTLKEIRELLELRPDPHTSCDEVRCRAETKMTAIDQKIESLRAMNRALGRLVAACDGKTDAGACPILAALDATDHPDTNPQPRKTRHGKPGR